MELPPDDPEAWLRIIKDKGLGLEFRVDRASGPMDSGEVLDTLARVSACRALIAATAVFGRWLEDPGILDGTAAAAAIEFRRVLRDGSEGDRLNALLRLGNTLQLYDYRVPAYLDELRFEFAGAYLENPTGLRFVAKGAMLALGLTISVLAALQGKKEWDAAACRARADEMEGADLGMLRDLARMEGRWTSMHAGSHKTIVEAAQVARQACGSTLSGLEFKLHVPPGIDFEIRLAQSYPPPRP